MNYKIIEFFGLPASGKTTLKKELENIYKEVPAIKPMNKNKYRYSKNSLKYAFICLKIWLFKPHKEGNEFLRWKSMYGKFAQMMIDAEQKESEPFFLDHGLVQSLTSLLNGENCKEKYLCEYLNIIHKCFKGKILFVYFDIDNEEAYQRMIKRGKQIRLLGYDRDKAIKVMEKSRKYFEYVFSYMENQGCAIKIDSCQNIQDNMEKIMKHMEENIERC